MKKIILFSIALIFGVYAQAQQFKAVYEVRNVPNAAEFTVTITGIDTTKTVTATLCISNNISGIPILDSSVVMYSGSDSVTFKDTLSNFSILTADYYYPIVKVIQSDTLGNTDTAIVITPQSPPVLTPPFTAPAFLVDSQKAMQDTLVLNLKGDPGFDVTFVKVYMDYASSLFKNPSWNYPAVVDTVLPLVGVVNQVQNITYKIPLGRIGYPYSFVVVYGNSVKTDTTQIFNDNTSGSATKKMDFSIDSVSTITGKMFATVSLPPGEETSQLNVGIVKKQQPNIFLQSFALKQAKPGVNFYEVEYTVPLEAGTEYTVTIWGANKNADTIIKEFQVQKSFVYNPTTSVITTEQQKDEVLAYPNPVQDVLHIRSSSDDVVRYILYNSVGCAMREIVHVHGGQTTLKVSGLPAGTYLLQPVGKTTKHSSLRIQIQ